MHEGEDISALPVSTVFLDRDGTIIEDKVYLGDPEGVALLPGAAAGLRLLAGRGLDLFVVTNQSGIGRGYFSLDGYLACRAELTKILAGFGVVITDEAFCPHAPEAACGCRKPGLGMWRELSARHGLVPEACIIIGDRAGDLEFGYAAGFALSILTLTGEGLKTAAELGIAVPDAAWSCLETVDRLGRPLLLVRNLQAAADWLLPRLRHFKSA